MKTLFSCIVALFTFGGTAMALENPATFNLWEQDELQSGNSATPNEPVPPGITLFKLVTMTSDQDSNRTDLSLMLDAQNQVTGMYNKPDANNRDDSDTKSKNVFWLKDIESPKGSVVLVKRGRNILIMQGKLDKASQEGTFTLSYLTNGIFMSYDSCEFALRKSGSNWFVENTYTGDQVNSIKVITHSLGVTTLEGLCPNFL
jgi:hypothetical protein